MTNLSNYITSDASDSSDNAESLSSSVELGSALAPSTAPFSASPEVSNTGPTGAEAAEQALFNDVLIVDTAEEAIGSLPPISWTKPAPPCLPPAKQARRSHTYLRSCPLLEATSFLQEQDCSWVGVIGSKTKFENETEGDGTKVDERSFGWQAGIKACWMMA